MYCVMIDKSKLTLTRFKVKFEETKSKISIFLLIKKQSKCPKSPTTSHFLGIFIHT